MTTQTDSKPRRPNPAAMRLDDDLAARLERLRVRLEKPGMNVTLSAAYRVAMLAGLDVIDRDGLPGDGGAR
jgi:hypothetical protein